MLDRALLKKAVAAIEENLNGRDVVMYGRNTDLQYSLEFEGYDVKAVFTGDAVLLENKELNCSDFKKMKGKSNEYYVIIPFFLPDGGVRQRQIMEEFGYTETKDFIFFEQVSQAKVPAQSIEEIYSSLISELQLVPNERMTVCYFDNIGDFYSLCAKVKYAEDKLNREYILLYHSDAHQDILDAFNADNAIKSYRLSTEEFSVLCRADAALQTKYQSYCITWHRGDEEFRKLTGNVYPHFAEGLRKPQFPEVDISKKYKKYINPGKTVLLIPTAKAVKPYPIWVWNFIAEFLRAIGLDVIFNVDSRSAHLYNGKSFIVPISEIVRFADTCGYVIGVRCGLFDILETTTAKMLIFSTKFYEPLDKVFGIPNDDERIKTLFYEEDDPFFAKDKLIGCVNSFFEKSSANLNQCVNILSDSSFMPFGDYKTARGIVYFSPSELSNNFRKCPPPSPNSTLSKIDYLFTIYDNKINFKIKEPEGNKFKYDYKIYNNDRIVFWLNETFVSSLAYPLTKSGEYYIDAAVTDTDTYMRASFETERVCYYAGAPGSLDELPFCNDLYAYITALERLGSQVTAFFATRDAHTGPEKNKITHTLSVMKLLGFKTDLESTYRHSFIGVVDGSKIAFESDSLDQTLRYQFDNGEYKAIIESSGFNVSQSPDKPCIIEINGVNKAVNSRGLNVVVLNKKTRELIDSVSFDVFGGGEAYRKDRPVTAQAALPSYTKQLSIRSSETIVNVMKNLESDNLKLIREIASLKNSLLQVDELKQQISVLDKKAVYLQNNISDKEIAITKLENKLYDKDLQLEDLAKQLDDKNSHIALQQKEMSEKIKSTQASSESVLKVNGELKGTIDELKNQIAMYENSRSWRITKPLRKIAGLFKKA